MKQNKFGTGHIDYGFVRRARFLFDTPNPDPKPNPPPAPDAKDTEIADLKKKLADAEAAKNPPAPKPDDDLAAKAAKEREAKEKQAGDTAKLEKALKFNLGTSEFLKNNASLLPSSTAGIFAQAEKEVYANAIEKADAIKVGLVSEFFAVQVNLDLLTDAQKNALAEFQALTKNVKQERVQQIYDMVFEPAFESLKRITKAKQVREGEVDPTDAKAAYAKRMMETSRAKFIKKGDK